MKNKNRYVPLLVGSLFAFSSCHKEISHGQLLDEFTKHDPWLQEVLLKDVTVKVATKKDMSLGDRLGIVDTYGIFDSSTDVLIFPYDGSFSKETVDGVDHELAHVITDTLGVKGLMFRRGYNGPSLDDVIAEMGKIYERAEFDSLRNRYHQEEVVRDNLRTLVDIKSLLSATDDYRGIVNEMEEYQKENARFEKSVNKRRLQEQKRGIKRGLDELHTMFAGLNIPDSTEIKNSFFKRILALQSKEIQDKTHVFRDIEAYCTAVFSEYEMAQQRHFETKKARLEKKIEEEDDWEQYLGELELVEHEYAQVKDDQESWKVYNSVKRKVSSFSLKLALFTNELEYAAGISATSGVMIDPFETFARMIDSLYSLRYGPPTHFQFPLHESDLQFLDSFTYDGAKIFRKGVERYRLGLRMLEDGVPEKEIMRLEHAETFSYAGTVYNWPKTDVTLRFIK
jgi:hypothetical protein